MSVNKKHIGSSLDELLAADGTLAEVTTVAEARVRVYESMKRASYALIPCLISPGMFDNEYAAEIRLPRGESVSLFVDSGLIEGTHPGSNKALLKVTFVRAESSRDEKTVLLPTEALESGSRWLSLPSDQVLAA